MPRRLNAKKPHRRIFPAFPYILAILVFSFACGIYYWARVNEKFGLQPFIRIQLGLCREPLFLNPSYLTDTVDTGKWNVIRDTEYGVSFRIPDAWTITADCGSQICINSPDLEFYNNGSVTGSRLMIDQFGKNEQIPEILSERPVSVAGFLKTAFSCRYGFVQSYPAVYHHSVENNTDTTVYAIEGDEANYRVVMQNWTDGNMNTAESILASFAPVPIKQRWIGDTGPYNGVPSPMVPYTGINFTDIDIYSNRVFRNQMFSSDSAQDRGIAGFTFTANKGDLVRFVVQYPKSLNTISAVLELYSYGPTVLTHETNLEWRVPVTGRYFLVLKRPKDNDVREFDLHVTIGK